MIYLDNAATTRVFDSAAVAADSAMRSEFFNPNATYPPGVCARNIIERSREKLAALAGAGEGRIVFTSCATESNNWVLSCARRSAKSNIVISAGEHASVYEPAMQLKNRGVDVRIVPLTKDGTVDIEAFKAVIDENTSLVSIIHVSNETGAVNDIAKLVRVTKSVAPRALFHSDGVQALLKLGKISELGVDFYSASGHKIGAPKGVGLLYIKDKLNLAPMIYGGGQESGQRSGTQNVPYIAAFAAAAEEFCARRQAAPRELREAVLGRLTGAGCVEIGGADNSGYILCVCVPDVKAEILQNAVYDRGVIIGKGSACSGSKRGNRVLEAMGLDRASTERCVRLSFGIETSYDDAMTAADIMIETAEALRSGHVG